MTKPRYITHLDQVPQLTPSERELLAPVVEKYAFRTNDYYQSLIRWDDPQDPIRRIIMPDVMEEMEWGELDVSHEEDYTVAPGCQHKYRDTAVLLCNDVCGGYCRFCFRKRIFMDDNDEAVRDVSPGLEYISRHLEISNVLLSGGDPLLMSTRKLEGIISRLRGIGHVKIIRIGTKIPAFNPFRITGDPALLEMIARFSTPRRRIYIMAHFNHPRELTDAAVEALDLLHRAGAEICNQTPLIRKVNDDPAVLGRLFKKLSFIGVPPYYVFQCRPTEGNLTYAVPVEKSIDILDRARRNCSGLAKRARLTMSHHTGKIEVLATDDRFVYFKYLRAANPADLERFFAYRRNADAYWLDDYEEFAAEREFTDLRDGFTTERR